MPEQSLAAVNTPSPIRANPCGVVQFTGFGDVVVIRPLKPALYPTESNEMPLRYSKDRLPIFVRVMEPTEYCIRR